MTITILTLFPDMVQAVLGTSMLRRAADAGAVTFRVEDLRQWGVGPHKSVDDTPYGGGAGMVLRVDVIDQALVALAKNPESGIQNPDETPRIILMTPQGKKFDQRMAEKLSSDDRDLILIAGHYEGFDERIRSLVDEEISIGDFVVTGGELPALIVADAVTRLLPNALGSNESVTEESFSLKLNSQLSTLNSRLLEYPHYTRPDSYTPVSRNMSALSVPEILKSGDHGKIAAWRRDQSHERTRVRRGDLLEPKSIDNQE